MKRFFTIVGVLMLASMLVCAAPQKKHRVKKQVTTTVQTPAVKTPTVETNTKQAAPKELLMKFRLEYQQAANRNCSSSAVMSCSQSEYGDYVYYRGFGQHVGYSFEFQPGVCSNLMLELSRIAEDKALADNKFTDLDDEDLTKPRWLVTMTSKDGKKYSMVEYSDGSDLHKLVDEAFQPVLKQVEKRELKVPFSVYNYNSDGSLDYRIDHTADGTVHGGYDPKDPYKTY